MFLTFRISFSNCICPSFATETTETHVFEAFES
jgi:hypothetical protein